VVFSSSCSSFCCGNYLKDKTFYTNKTKVYEMDKIYSYDIDDKLDFEGYSSNKETS